ncbi:putative flippase AglR [uncultured archaeon]|nr:putative flippase AglR [uncultured archaeon]
MNALHRVAKNTGLLLLADIIAKALSIIYAMYVARYLGPEGYGVIGFAMAFTGILGVASDLGIGTLIIRDLARDPSQAKKYLGNIILIKILLALVAFALIGLTINLMGYPGKTIEVVYLLTLYVIFGGFAGIFTSEFQASQRMEYISLGRVLSPVLLLAFSLYAVSKQADVVVFAAIYAVVNLILFVYSFLVSYWRFARPELKVDMAFWRSSIKEALPFGITSLSIVIYYQISRVILSLMVDNKAVGYYTAAYNLVINLLFFYAAFTAAIFPLLSSLYPSSKESFKLIFEKSVKYLWIVAIPMGAGVTLLASRIIGIIYGPEFTPAVIALQILVWAHVVIYMNTFANVLNNIGQQILVTRQTVICAVFNIFLNLMLIPHYGFIGSSLATLATESLAFTILYYYISKTEFRFPLRRFFGYFMKISAATLVMASFVVYFINVNIIIIILAAIFIYFISLYLVKGIEEDDIQFAEKLVQSRFGK